MQLDFDDYYKIRDYIYSKTGIFFDNRKIYFVRKRLEQRITAVKAKNPIDYLRYLKFTDPQEIELQAFINLLTTNETYFFREFAQLAVFAEHCLPEICRRKISLSSRRLRIWSAGCSTGEEPYTLAIILREMLEDPDEWFLDVLATDLDTNVLRHAARGIYDRRSVKNVPQEYMENWFTKTRDGQYRVHPLIKKMCRFESMNLSQGTKMAPVVNVDFIFCRNVLIYFDATSRTKVVKRFYRSLNPGGYVFLGHSESIGRISTDFRPRRKQDMLLYQKPIR